MCSKSVTQFVKQTLSLRDVQGKDVLEVGSRDVNGSIRSLVVGLNPRSYIGVDIVPGPGVDQICDICGLLQTYGPVRFDLVISTETLEHVMKWRTAVTNLKLVAKPGGMLVLTTRSIGFDYHGYPHDYWRYQVDDMRAIFADLDDLVVQPDGAEPGVFVSGRRPLALEPVPLDQIQLFSILTRRRTRDFAWWQMIALYLLGANRRIKRLAGIPQRRDAESCEG
jgi:hypothetical protein